VVTVRPFRGRIQGPAGSAELAGMSAPLLAAVLIVRDETGMLPGCLASLAGLADEIHVHDTGSTDGTAELAQHLGATVTRGDWDDDFGAARNQAAAASDATWVLALDADHRVAGATPGALRELLTRATTDALRVEVADAHHANPYRQHETRLYRPAAVRFSGRVHEKLIRPDGQAADRSAVPTAWLSLSHLGHATAADRLRRADRNLALGRRMLGELPGADRERIAGVLLALGRDCVAAEQWQAGADTFELLRETFPGTAEWVQATDGLARLVLAQGHDRACLVLAGQLRDAGAAPSYCDWLAAQALAQLGDPDGAAVLLSGVTEIVDTAGRRRDPALLHRLATMIDSLIAQRA
jgi:glycosyl transferase family 2